MVVFPVVVNKRVRGAVRAFMEKKKGRSSYLTTEGSWIKTHGMFPYDYVKKAVKRNGYDFIILVEGPRDALALISKGLPALAVLGAGSLTEKKILMLSSLLTDGGKIYVMSDNDRAGKQMYQTVESLCEGMYETQRILMPKETDKEGNKIKYDPDNCPDWYMKRVIKFLCDNHESLKITQRKRKRARARRK